MSYEIELSRRAEEEVLRLDPVTFARIKAAIDGLAEKPRPVAARKLRGRENEWRIRVGRFGCSTLFITARGRFSSTVLPTGRMCTVADAQGFSKGRPLCYGNPNLRRATDPEVTCSIWRSSS